MESGIPARTIQTITTIRMTTEQNLALIIGSSGGLGAALLAQLEGDAKYAQVIDLSRSTQVSINYDDETSIAKAAQHIADLCAELNLELRLLVVATGFLHGDQGQPERSFTNLCSGQVISDSLIDFFDVDSRSKALGDMLPSFECSLMLL